MAKTISKGNSMNNLFFQKIIGMFITKKRMIGWGATIIISLSAAAAGMQTHEFKEIICGAPILDPVK